MADARHDGLANVTMCDSIDPDQVSDLQRC